MKILTKLWLLPAFALAATSCSDDSLGGKEADTLTSGDNVYIAFSIANATKSATTTEGTETEAETGQSTDGTENSKDYESAINTATICLVKADGSNELLGTTEVKTDSDGKFVGEFASSALNNWTGQSVYVYFFANRELDLYDVAYFDQDCYEADGNAPYGFSAGDFVMTNTYMPTTITLPENLSSYKSSSNAFDLGTIIIDRVAARFDLALGGDNNDNVFVITSTDGKEEPGVYAGIQVNADWNGNDDLAANARTRGDESVTLAIKITHASLINNSKSYYFFRHVAADKSGLADTSNINFLGYETTSNWVIDHNWSAKSATTLNSGMAQYFNSHLSYPNKWTWTDLSNLDNNTANNTASWNTSGDYKTYYIWQYANENTCTSIDGQKNGVSTGIVFRGEIIDNETGNCPFDGENPVYVYNNILYGYWEQVAEAAENANDNSLLKNAYNACVDTDGNLNESVVGKYFTVIRPDKKGAYCVYYYYWNRHNDNGDNGKMGVMEFATVRNNVYKICVESITKWGHPTPKSSEFDPTVPDPEDPENPDLPDPEDPDQPDPDDPDPVLPDNPDEDETAYFKVSVTTQPWIVRINNASF